MMRFGWAALAVGVALAPVPAFADDETPPVVGGRTYTQHQIEAARAAHPQIASILVTGKREGDKAPVIFGATAGAARVFRVAPALGADGAVMGGGHCTARKPFLSSTQHRIGTIEIAFKDGVSQADCTRIAAAVQARIARDTLSAKNAADPYPFDAKWGPNTYAQLITEKTIAKHPDLLVVMIHASPTGAVPNSKTNLIVGSNIGRFGKMADEDDARVIDKGTTNLEVGGDNDRFETELPLNDASGKRIGALGLVFNYKVGQDKEAIHAHGLAIRDEIAKEIPNNAALFRHVR